MEHFLRLNNLFHSFTRWLVAKRIYKEASARAKWRLWGGKFIFLVGSVLIFEYSAYFLLVGLGGLVWLAGFCTAKAEFYSSFPKEYRESIHFFELDYQYVRYLYFKQAALVSSSADSFEEALNFLDNLVETDNSIEVSAHPMFAVVLGLILAVIGGASGQWPADTTAWTLIALVIALAFASMGIVAITTRKSALREFRRFLLWVREDQIAERNCLNGKKRASAGCYD